MVDPVPRPVRKKRESDVGFSVGIIGKRLEIRRRERFFARKNNHALSSGSLEETAVDVNICNWINTIEVEVNCN